MDLIDGSRKTLLLALAFFTFVGLGSAGLTIQHETVWKNGYWNGTVEKIAVGSCGGENLEYKAKGASSYSEVGKNLTTDAISEGLDVGEYEVKCSNASSSEGSFELKEVKYDTKRHGEGFVGSKIGKKKFTRPIVVDGLEIESSDSQEISSQDVGFEFDSPRPGKELSLEDEEKDLETISPGSKMKAILNPLVNEYILPGQENYLYITDKDTGKRIHKIDLNTTVHKIQISNIYENPPGNMDFSEVKRDFSYRMDISQDSNEAVSISSENFVISIEDIESEEDYSVEEKHWFELDDTAQDGEYEIRLNQFPDELPIGSYEFSTYIEYGDEDFKKFKIGETRVDKKIDFSGTIRDSKGNVIQTDMILNTDDTSYSVSTGSNGKYRTFVEPDSEYDLNMSFYDRGKASPDANFMIGDADLSDGSTSVTSRPISFQYWTNPSVDISGVKPVNMMSISFAYDVGGSASASMKYDPARLNYDEAQVYECSFWNFEKRDCVGGWSKMDDDQVSVNLYSNEVNIEDLELHEVSEDVGGSEKKTLMNAYVVGTNSGLSLNNGIRISGSVGGKAAGGEKVEVSGRIVNAKDEFVNSANVDVSYVEGSRTVETYSTETDIDGKFSINEPVPEEKGNYSIKVEASKSPYQSIERTFEKKVDVYVERALSIESMDSIRVDEGESNNLTLTISNPGQRKVENIELSTEGYDNVDLSGTSIAELSTGESAELTANIEIPSGFCTNGCSDYPSFTVKISGNSDETSVEEEKEIQTQVVPSRTVNASSDESEEDSNDNTGQGLTSEVNRIIGEATGAANVSSTNLILGLVMLGMMVFAGAVKKKKNDSGSDREQRGSRSGGRPKIQRPDLSGSEPEEDEIDEAIEQMSDIEDDEVDQKIEEIAELEDEDENEEEEMEETEQIEDDQDPVENEDEEGEEDGADETVCPECGKEFDTESGRKLHEQMMHEDE
ncbi:MAG: hypothetical protein H8Z69_03490 [Nanohaloarchaea archaeon]|nr:hypothetical protein [Candidatus Nanohaloarchaea archaeon]